MSMTTELAQRMKAAALKATPGEWVYLPSNTSIEYDYGSDDSQGSITYMDSGDFTQKQTELNGIFIALANPANVLALVEALEARDLTLSARDYHYDQQADRIQSLEKALEAAEQNSDGVAGMAEHYETTISMLKSRIAELENQNEYIRKRYQELDLLIGKNILVMQAAIIEWQGTGDAKNGLAWIYNTLFGPGELPDEEEKDAQAYFDRKYAPLDEKLMELHQWFWEQQEKEKQAPLATGVAVEGE